MQSQASTQVRTQAPTQAPAPKTQSLAGMLYTWLTRAFTVSLVLGFQGLIVYFLFLRYGG